MRFFLPGKIEAEARTRLEARAKELREQEDRLRLGISGRQTGGKSKGAGIIMLGERAVSLQGFPRGPRRTRRGRGEDLQI